MTLIGPSSDPHRTLIGPSSDPHRRLTRRPADPQVPAGRGVAAPATPSRRAASDGCPGAPPHGPVAPRAARGHVPGPVHAECSVLSLASTRGQWPCTTRTADRVRSRESSTLAERASTDAGGRRTTTRRTSTSAAVTSSQCSPGSGTRTVRDSSMPSSAAASAPKSEQPAKPTHSPAWARSCGQREAERGGVDAERRRLAGASGWRSGQGRRLASAAGLRSSAATRSRSCSTTGRAGSSAAKVVVASLKHRTHVELVQAPCITAPMIRATRAADPSTSPRETAAGEQTAEGQVGGGRDAEVAHAGRHPIEVER